MGRSLRGMWKRITGREAGGDEADWLPQNAPLRGLRYVCGPYLVRMSVHPFGHRVGAYRAAWRGKAGLESKLYRFRPPAAEQLACGLNAPAMVAASLFDPLINRMHPTCRQSEYFDHAVIGLFVPFLWYFIGRLADNGDSARFRSCIRAHKVWACLGVFVLSAFATLIGASFFLTSPLDYLVLRVCMLGWIGLGVFTLLAGMRGGRATAAPA